ncbi:hypothetical protein H488_0104960 [Kocuria sp. UCD-OTCP]|nr:hypothetical protein H488_0104960 [Kocuria sp. UCD-OTCP]
MIAATGYRTGLEDLVGGLGVLDERGLPRDGTGREVVPGLRFVGYVFHRVRRDDREAGGAGDRDGTALRPERPVTVAFAPRLMHPGGRGARASLTGAEAAIGARSARG